LGLDVESTGRIDVVATWTDVTDDGPEAASVPTERRLEHFFSLPIERKTPLKVRMTHEFGDTKYRTVTYWVDAITRYREYFDPGESPELFHAPMDQTPIVVKSSARPDPLTVLGTYPAFSWSPMALLSNRIEHRRTGRTVRVELARPWYRTGDGEVLGVLVATTGGAAASDLVTRIGRDPMFGAPPPDGIYPAPAWFSNAAGPAMDVATGVAVVPIGVEAYDDRWYADVQLTPTGGAAGSYAPLVELVVARYQPYSLPGLETSKAQLTDGVPLLPDRLVVVDRSGGSLRVTVSGVAPVEPANVVTAVVEQANGPTDLIALEVAGTIPAWKACSPVVSGGVGAPLPALALPAGATHLRVRITEYEGLDSAHSVSPPELGRRNVMTDVIDVPSAWHP
jgi:hypothetical protein